MFHDVLFNYDTLLRLHWDVVFDRSFYHTVENTIRAYIMYEPFTSIFFFYCCNLIHIRYIDIFYTILDLFLYHYKLYGDDEIDCLKIVV